MLIYPEKCPKHHLIYIGSALAALLGLGPNGGAALNGLVSTLLPGLGLGLLKGMFLAEILKPSKKSKGYGHGGYGDYGGHQQRHGLEPYEGELSGEGFSDTSAHYRPDRPYYL